MSMTTPSQYGGPTPDPNPVPGPLFTGLDPYTAPAPSSPATGTSTAAALAGIKVSEVPWQTTPWGTIAANGKQAFRFTNFTSDRIGFAFEQPPSNTTFNDGDFAWVLPRVFINGTEVFPFPADPWGADTFPDGQTSGDPGVYESGIAGLFVNKLPGVTSASSNPTPGPGFTGDTSGTDGTGGTPGPGFTGDTGGTFGPQIAPTEVIIFADSLPRVQGWTFCYGLPELDPAGAEPAGESTANGPLSTGWHRSGPVPTLISPEEWSQSNWYETSDFFGIFVPPGLLYAWPFADPIGKDYNDPANYVDTAGPNDPPGQTYQFYFLPEGYPRSGWLRICTNPSASTPYGHWEYVGNEASGRAMRLWTGRGTINGGYVQDTPGANLPYTAGLLKLWDGTRWSMVTTFGSPNTPPGADWPSNLPGSTATPTPGPLFTGDTGTGGTPGPGFTG